MQISSSLAAIIAAVCATLGALLGTTLTSLYNHHLEKNKRRRQERDAVSKFRDVLLRSSEQLQSHVGELCSRRVPRRVDNPSLTDPASSYAYCILIYRIGQLLCWVFLLENDIRTIHYTPTEDDHHIMDILDAIHEGLGRSWVPLIGREIPLRIFRGVQDSIGELMTVGDGEKGTQRCMGYPDFWKKWTVSEEDNEFKPWFSQIEEGLGALSVPRWQEWFFRVIEFQHLLIQLVNALDPKNVRGPTRPRFERIDPLFLVELCLCTQCARLRKSDSSATLPKSSQWTLPQSTNSQTLSLPTVGGLEPRGHGYYYRTYSESQNAGDMQSTSHSHSSSRLSKTTSQPPRGTVGDLGARRHNYEVPEDL